MTSATSAPLPVPDRDRMVQDLHARQHGLVGRDEVTTIVVDSWARLSELNPAVVESLARMGISLEQAYPKPVTDEVARAADVVVSMGCGDTCPLAPGARYLEWDVPDPDGLDTAEVAPIRDQIDRRVRALLEELT